MIIKILSNSKQILWQEQWDLTKYETTILIDEIEYIVYVVFNILPCISKHLLTYTVNKIARIC